MHRTPPGPRGSAESATLATDNRAADAAKKLVAAPRRALKAACSVRRFGSRSFADTTAVTCHLSTASEVAPHFGKGCTACLPELF